MGRHFFRHKLTGAQAILFAEGCRQFSEDAEESDNQIAAPITHPIFSWLSPQQRIHLVRELVVGLLCPNEPLPPYTIQHYAAYLAIFTCIDAALKNEVDPPNVSPKRQTPEEMLEDEKNRLLVTMSAEEGVKQLYKCNIAAVTPCDEAETFRHFLEKALTTTNPTTTFSDISDIIFSDAAILLSKPCSAEERIPSRLLSYSEMMSTFRWRLLCDAALQQDRALNYSFAVRVAPITLALAMVVWAFLSVILPKSLVIAIMTLLTPMFLFLLKDLVTRISMPLCFVDFCWKSSDYRKWNRSLALLRQKMNPCPTQVSTLPLLSSPTQKLLSMPIQEATYADVSKHVHIRVVESKVRDLRERYDATWEPSDTGVDQLCIFAVCGTEKAIGGNTMVQHKEFALAFEAECRARGFLVSERGHFQERYDAALMQSNSCNMEDLERGFYTGRKFVKASEFVADKGLPVRQCNTCKKKSGDDDDHLMTCSRCQVVWYCSVEHQREDWSKHKKICSCLAATRKDKDKMKEIVQTFQS